MMHLESSRALSGVENVDRVGHTSIVKVRARQEVMTGVSMNHQHPLVMEEGQIKSVLSIMHSLSKEL